MPETRVLSERPGGYREMLRLAYPLFVSMGTFTIMQFCDRIFLARYSSVSIQAALPAGILSFTLVCFFQALAGYSGTFVAHHHGARDPEGCVRATVQGLWIALVSWPVIVALIPAGFWVMRLSGHAPDVLQEELRYFWIMMACGVSVPLSSAIGGYFTGRGRLLANTLCGVAGCLLNLVLDYLMIFGHGGFPRMGITGAAVATAISGFLPPLVLLVLFLRDPVTRRLGRGAWNLDLPLVRQICSYGAPAGGHLLVDVGSFTVFVLMTGRLDPLSFAASNIGLSINSVAFMPLLAISFAASILVGQYQGRREPAHAARAGWTALRLGWGYMLLAGLSFVCFPEGYYRLFRSPEAAYSVAQLVEAGRPMLWMMAAWGMCDAINIILSGALKGAGDTRFVLLYMLSFGWLVWLPGAWVIFHYGWGIQVAWLWMTMYVFFLSAGFWWRWRSGRWQRFDLLARELPALPTRTGTEGLVIGD